VIQTKFAPNLLFTVSLKTQQSPSNCLFFLATSVPHNTDIGLYCSCLSRNNTGIQVYSSDMVHCINFIIFLCVSLKLFSLSFVPILAPNPGDATACKHAIALLTNSFFCPNSTCGWPATCLRKNHYRPIIQCPKSKCQKTFYRRRRKSRTRITGANPHLPKLSQKTV